MTTFQTETLLVQWAALDNAIKRVQNSTPDQLSSAMEKVEQARRETHELIVSIAKAQMESK